MSSLVKLPKQLEIARRKAKKTEAFVTMLEDPSLERIGAFVATLADPDLQELVSAMRNGHQVGRAPEAPKHKFAAGLTAAIVALRPQLPKQFLATDVLKLLEEQKFQFNSNDHLTAVKNALWRLADSKQLKTISGKGGKPSSFEWL